MKTRSKAEMETIRRCAAAITEPWFTENWGSWAPPQREPDELPSFLCHRGGKCAKSLEEMKYILRVFPLVNFSHEALGEIRSIASNARITSSTTESESQFQESFVISLSEASRITKHNSWKQSVGDQARWPSHIFPVADFIKEWRTEYLKTWMNLSTVLHKEKFLYGKY